MAKKPFCTNPNCHLYRVAGGENIVRFGSYETKHGKKWRYRCNRCGETFSERALTDLYGLHADKKKVDKVLKQIKGGKSLRQIEKESGIKLDTIHARVEPLRPLVVILASVVLLIGAYLIVTGYISGRSSSETAANRREIERQGTL